MRQPLPHPHRYRTAVRYIAAEYLRNRTALFLLVVFVPLWYVLMVATMPHDPVSFRFRPTGGFLSVDSQGITVLTAGLNAITIVVGFLIFSTTKRGISFDHRLVLCGYPQRILLAAKLTAMALAACAVTGYATLVLLLFFRPESILVVFLGLASTGIAYGALGFLLGVLVRGELEGFFAIIMLSLIDTFMQNPVGNPLANKDVLTYFPSFGATQAYVAGGFTHMVPWDYLGVALVWPLAFIGLGMLIFARRTWVPRARPVFLAAALQRAAT